MRNRILIVIIGVLLFGAGYLASNGRSVLAQSAKHGGIPKAYGHIVSAVVTPGGTSLVFEDAEGTIRFVTLTGEVESELTRN